MVASSALRGASAESLATLDEQLSAALGGADGTADAAQVGDDLFGAAMLLQRESALRRTATDASLDVDARSGLVRQVLGVLAQRLLAARRPPAGAFPA